MKSATLPGVGLIGCGRIARSAHLLAYARLRHQMELVAVADVRMEQAEQTARDFGADAWYDDYRQLLERRDIRFVDICTPQALHREQVVAALRAGKHVICEKPMAASLHEADAMLQASRETGRNLMIAHSRRFTPRYMWMRELVDQGAIGRVRLVKENERRPRSMEVGAWEPEPGKPWAVLPGFMGSMAMGMAIHEVDLFRWFMGDEVESVYAESRAATEEDVIPTLFSLTLQFRNGGIATSEIARHLPHGYPYFHQWEVYGEQGLIRAMDPDMQTLSTFDANGMHHPLAYDSLLHIHSAYEREISQFVEATLAGKLPPLPPEEARAALELSLAVLKSSETHQVVRLPLAE